MPSSGQDTGDTAVMEIATVPTLMKAASWQGKETSTRNSKHEECWMKYKIPGREER